MTFRERQGESYHFDGKLQESSGGTDLHQRTEIRDGKEYTVIVLNEREGLPFFCFACKRTLPRDRLSRSDQHKRAKKCWFLCKGCDWKRQDRIEEQKEEARNAVRNPQTKYPFNATLNGKQVVVWPDRIELEEDDG